MARYGKGILAPIAGIIALIMGAFELFSAMSRVNTGLKIFIFSYNTTSDAVVSFHKFEVMRDGFYTQVYGIIFTYLPFMNDVPEVGWNLVRAAIFLAGAYIIFKLWENS